ncbi:hypothetical protein HHK36_007243 [Tetracentron sinense]|uniref:Uncharacterized protein n=1 Tax=Tetracentron sinense TaxID=13715 RepID=A0A834ZJG1_TETSI|nr:hypothetical protein HHK36_007243 [Tetracentron sinense]
MGRPPCCEKIGVKKGPWTPEEDIILVSYIQEHGPGNWRAVPTNTGLDGHNCRDGYLGSQQVSKGRWENRLQTDIHMARKALSDALSLDQKPSYSSDFNVSNGYSSYTIDTKSSSTYASSTENIARLLEGWMRNSPKSRETIQNSFNNTTGTDSGTSSLGTPENNNDILSPQLLFGFESSTSEISQSMSLDEIANFDERKPDLGNQVPFSVLEKWLFDESAAQGQEDLIEISLDDSADEFF